MRQYAAPLRPDLKLCDIADVAQETWAHLESARMGRRASLTPHASDGHQECTADRFMIEQVFRNIFENSLAACPDAVEITVEWERVGESLKIVVRDNGPGLSPEQRLRIFEPFYATKTRGTGLGMTLVQRIVQAHGGSIRVGEGPGGVIIVEMPQALSR